jgi:hypothetical protein
MGSQRPGPMCTTNGDYIDDGTMCRGLSPNAGPVCIETRGAPPSPSLDRAMRSFESDAVNFAVRFIPDNAVRQQYVEKIRRMADDLLDAVKRGEMTAKEAQQLAHQLRNEIMETARGASSDVGRAWAEALKRTGRTLSDLQEAYAQRLFGRGFGALAEAEQNEVFLAVINASGRARPSVLIRSVRFARFAKGLLYVTVAFAVSHVATAEDPGRAVAKEVVVVGAGVGGAALAGLATSVVCGPGAPVCAALLVFVGGGLAAFGSDYAFDWAFH